MGRAQRGLDRVGDGGDRVRDHGEGESEEEDRVPRRAAANSGGSGAAAAAAWLAGWLYGVQEIAGAAGRAVCGVNVV